MKKFFLATYLWILLLPPTFFFVGAASNQLVLIANHDTFPVLMNGAAVAHVMPFGYDDQGHVLMTSQTHLNALGDIFDFHDDWVSIGDLFLSVGTWLQTFCPFVWGVLIIKKVLELEE